MTDVAINTRQRLLRELKFRGGASQSELAEALGLTREAVRQQLALLEAQSLVWSEAAAPAGRGRPTHRYRLTEAAEALFPKFYDELTLTLIEALGKRFGEEGLREVLAQVTDAQVAHWQPKLAGKTLAERMEALRGLYFDADPYTEVREDRDGVMLVEHNCPYLNAARDEPRLCSVTVSTLSRLLGVEVERTERFQQGDGRCVFRVHVGKPVPEDFRFAWEPERKAD
ncbi:MAG TPA: methanogen output domain 1-containing protein [Gammaproteobacteria bacterium]|nr:methanogen output domain 1-containing protein [Gammaproteobacteria bacterium]